MASKKTLHIYLLAVASLLFLFHETAIASKKDRLPLKFVIKTEAVVDKSIKETISKLNDLSKNMEKTAKLFETTHQPVYWENEAKQSFSKLLESEGYYNTAIETEVIETTNTIILNVNNWERYKIKKIHIKFAENSINNINVPDLKLLKIQAGEFAIAANILAAQHRLSKFTERSNCLLTLNVTHEAFIDNANDTISIDYIINAGPHTKVKSVDVKGLVAVNPEYARKLIPIKNGYCYRRSLIEEAQDSLQKTGLFSLATPEVPNHPDKNGEVPIVFDLKERKARSLKAGASYASDLGFGLTLGWNHRNFFGSGETVKSEIFANQRDQTFDLTFTKPFFKRDDQTLKLGTSLKNIKSKAYNSREGSTSAGVERKWDDIWVYGASGKYSYASIKETGKVQNFSFISIPIFARRDTRNNIFKPKIGSELTLKTEPFTTTKKPGKSFVKSEINASKYFSFTSNVPIIAVKVAFGLISGISHSKIPANEKFYLGGSGSLRGYAYQLAGPLDKSNRPVGGSSFIENTIELRQKINKTLGFVVFLDSGNVFESKTPRLNKKMFRGTGIGIRYYTDFGPLRFDIAIPLKKRKKVDKELQVYFGIGQDF